MVLAGERLHHAHPGERGADRCNLAVERAEDNRQPVERLRERVRLPGLFLEGTDLGLALEGDGPGLALEPGQFTRLSGCLALGVVKIGRYSNDCFSNFFTSFCFSISLNFLQNHCRNFFGTIFLITHSYLHPTIV